MPSEHNRIDDSSDFWIQDRKFVMEKLKDFAEMLTGIQREFAIFNGQLTKYLTISDKHEDDIDDLRHELLEFSKSVAKFERNTEVALSILRTKSRIEAAAISITAGALVTGIVEWVLKSK